MANGEKGAIIIQSLETGGPLAGLEAIGVTSLSGDKLPGVTTPAATQTTQQEPVALDGATYEGSATGTSANSSSAGTGLSDSDWIFIILGVAGLLLTIYYGERQ